MSFIEKKSDLMFLLRIKAKPNTKVQKIIKESDNTFLQVNLTSKPIKNRANKELLKLLRKKLKISSDQIQIISGLKSTNKTIQVIYNKKFNEKIILQQLLS